MLSMFFVILHLCSTNNAHDFRKDCQADIYCPCTYQISSNSSQIFCSYDYFSEIELRAYFGRLSQNESNLHFDTLQLYSDKLEILPNGIFGSASFENFELKGQNGGKSRIKWIGETAFNFQNSSKKLRSFSFTENRLGFNGMIDYICQHISSLREIMYTR